LREEKSPSELEPSGKLPLKRVKAKKKKTSKLKAKIP